MEKHFLETAKACLINGDRLLSDAETLSYDRSPTSLALAIIAEEEFAKGFLLFLVDSGVIPWNEAILLRVTRDHHCKQLLAMLMEYASPDFDEMNARFDRRGSRLSEIERLLEELPSFPEISDRTERAALLERRRQLLSEIGRIEEKIRDDDSFPDHVAGAINVLCYEEIWRLRWSSDEKDDRRAAQAIARARDREKQDAFYVDIGKTGQAISLPDKIDEAAVGRARERARQLRSLLSSVLENESVVYREFEQLIEALKVMFAGPEELARLFPDKQNPLPVAVGRRRASYQSTKSGEGGTG